MTSNPAQTPAPALDVSVIIPTYQRREFVRRAVASVLAQRLRSFELIVLDGGSTDGTAEALSGLDPRLRFVREPKPTVAAARNAAIALARAPLVAFLDSDNRWLPDHLETLTAALARHREAVLATSCPKYDLAGRECAGDARLVGYPERNLGMSTVGFLSCVLVRREVLLAVGGFDEELVVGEDSDLWLRLAYEGPFCVLRRRTLVRQRTRGGLKERGMRSGGFLDARDRIARRALAQEATYATPEAKKFATEARGILALVTGLRALQRGEHRAARAAFEQVCGSFPELSRRPTWVGSLIEEVPASSAHERLRQLLAAMDLWPGHHEDTAVYLRAWAAILALRTGRLPQALRLLAGWPLRSTRGFLSRNRRSILLDLRRRLRDYVRSNRETAPAEPPPNRRRRDATSESHRR